MKSNLNQIFFAAIMFLTLPLISCNTMVNKERKNEIVYNISASRNYGYPTKEYELAEETLKKLKKEKADNIILYHRTCINCCGYYYYIFWESKGETFLDKFYSDDTDRQTHALRINLSNDSIIEELTRNYEELKRTTIKNNTHTRADGSWYDGNTIDHYCYIEMSIYKGQDSVKLEAKDHDFDKYTNYPFSPSPTQMLESNDNYLENINSKWNALITVIENQIAALPETNRIELSGLRTRRQAQ